MQGIKSADSLLESWFMKKTWKPIIAGVLCILVGSLWVLVELIIGCYAFSNAAGEGSWVGYLLFISFFPPFVLAVIALCGGVFICMRKKWRLGLAGSCSGILIGIYFAVGVVFPTFAAKLMYGFYLLPAVQLLLSIPTIVLTIQSKKEFVFPRSQTYQSKANNSAP